METLAQSETLLGLQCSQLPPSPSLSQQSSPEYQEKADSLSYEPSSEIERCSGPPNEEGKQPTESKETPTPSPPPSPPPARQTELALVGQLSPKKPQSSLIILMREERYLVSIVSTNQLERLSGQEETMALPNRPLDSSQASVSLDLSPQTPPESPLLEAMQTQPQPMMTSVHEQEEEPSLLPQDNATEKCRILQEIISQTRMDRYRTSKLSLNEVLSVGPESLQNILLRSEEDVPSYFLRNLMSLNVNVRKTQPTGFQSRLSINSNNMETTDNAHFKEIHPLDVLCVLLNLSDSFLQQEIVSKMSMCQFAVPLLLPACDGPDFTFMLWAMRDIVKIWRTQSMHDENRFREDSVVRISMPVFSFVRFSNCSLSKSAILNQIISPPQRLLDFFMHQNMEGGNISKELSNGLVEMSWHFPTGQKGLDVFAEPIAVVNLRGDIMSNYKQFMFLNNISTAIFIFADEIGEAEYKLLAGLKDVNAKYFFIMSLASETKMVTWDYLRKLYPFLNLVDSQILVKTAKINDAKLVRSLQVIISDLAHRIPHSLTLEQMAEIAARLGIHVDEDFEECQTAKDQALKIIDNIGDVSNYKGDRMKLQKDLWKQISDTEKELCRMTKKHGEDGEHYKAKLIKRRSELLWRQNQHTLPQDIVLFKEMLTNSTASKKRFFLKWMKLCLDSLSAIKRLELQTKYRNKLKNGSASSDELKTTDMKILESSLGVEHFIRELGQFYEAEYFIQNNHALNTIERRFGDIPGMAADLLLDGFPLELMDGEASNIPLQWISNILLKLDEKTGGECRLRVISVLGVQSTGKSTLLNTMFGLHFPVASGRCTRGAFMTLIRVEENFQEELGCHFIVVIDTEGLKAPELATLENTYQHDNEMATLVIGLSDITMVNVSMENTSDIQDILQIVVHAFLRMNTVGKKPSCVFVHQNVSDVSAHEKNRRDRKKLKDQLDEMTKTVAKMENKPDIKGFSDVMEHNMENCSWYIAGLWCGVPPMASINSGYSVAIYELRKYLLQILKQQLSKSQRINDFSEWIKNLWNSVKHENFLFSFRNCLVAKAYNELSLKYSELQWNFQKAMDQWASEAENAIRNQTMENLQHDGYKNIIKRMDQVLDNEESSMYKSMDTYFQVDSEHNELIERYKEDFQKSIMQVKDKLKDSLSKRLEEAIRTKKRKQEFEEIQKKLLQTINDKVGKLHRKGKHKVKNKKLESMFNKIWQEALNESIPFMPNKQRISQTIRKELRIDLKAKFEARVAKSINRKKLSDYANKEFEMKKKYISKRNETQSEKEKRIKEKYDALFKQCVHYIGEKLAAKEDYRENYCRDLLNIINFGLCQDDFQKLQTTPWLELDIKLLIFGKLAPLFEEMHTNFLKDNGLVLQLEEVKPQYFDAFKEICQKTDTCFSQIRHFCDSCLKPALTGYIYHILGSLIVDDILATDASRRYGSRALFQFSVLKHLLQNKLFSDYDSYINDYETFVKRWILNHIEEKYTGSKDWENLLTTVVSFIRRSVFKVLNDPSLTQNLDNFQFLFTFCDLLKKELAISMNAIHVRTLHGMPSVQEYQKHFTFLTNKAVEDLKQEVGSLSVETVLTKLTLKPQDELFMKVSGCGKQCPFCKAPCEAGGAIHSQHFASVHRPRGLIGCRNEETSILIHSICSTNVVEDKTFSTSGTKGKVYPFKNYHMGHPDWTIEPDHSITASDYWKFVLKEFNEQFAWIYQAKPAEFPEEWKQITEEQAMKSLHESFNITMAVSDDP
ncbi:interferon-induced very large GTPase 1-like [Mantella aurantiaca]